MVEIDVRPQPGPQVMALESKADILIYGGQAGGGKSWLLVHEVLRRIHNPGFRGGIFRRTYPQLKGQGGIWDECQEVYRGCDAHLREGQELDATFPSGANVAFLHLQHEKTKYEYQGHQFCYLGFDELTHFTESQFFYMLSRNRSTCGIRPYVRATCNPEPGWVADFLSWWIDPELGTAIPERSGKLRYFIRGGDSELYWGSTKEELIAEFPEYEPDDILSVTFIAASLADNVVLQKKDPGYRARLMSLSRIERDRLLGGNWKVSEGAQIDPSWIHRFTCNQAEFHIVFQGQFYKIPFSKTRRIATIDTAGTSKEKSQVQRGTREPSWSVCSIWDTLEMWNTTVDGVQVRLGEFLFLRNVWRKQVDWNQLRSGINSELETWNVTKAYIENAHFGQALACEVRCCPVELIGPVISGMGDHGENAKLERAIASGMLARFEQGKIFIPRDDSPWILPWLNEVLSWKGLQSEPADQIDTISYAAHLSRRQAMVWGGTLPHNPNSFRSTSNGQGPRQVTTRSNR